MNLLGVEMRLVDCVNVESTELFRDWLMPVIAVDNGKLKVNGTAVCIGAGTFCDTAWHVVDYLLDDKGEDQDAEVRAGVGRRRIERPDDGGSAGPKARAR